MSLHDSIYVTWKHERESDTIIELAPDFYSRCREYIHHLESRAENEEEKLLAKLFEKRWQRVNYLLNDLITIRLQKLMNHLIGEEVLPEQLPLEELDFSAKLKSQLAKYRDRILGISDEVTILDEFDENSNEDPYEVVIFKKSEDSVSVGSDLKQYGPFDPDDVVIMPRSNMKTFLKRAKVERVELDQN